MLGDARLLAPELMAMERLVKNNTIRFCTGSNRELHSLILRKKIYILARWGTLFFSVLWR